MRCTSSYVVVVFGLVASLVGISCPLVGTASAAEATPPDPDAAAAEKAVADDEQKLLKVYPLKYVDGQTVLATAPQVAPDVTITLDSRVNRVMVHASRSGHAVVEELIKALDVPPDMTCHPIDLPDADANTTGAKGIGEPATVPTAPAIANAIYNATGLRMTDTTLDPARIVSALTAGREGD